jgi:glycosyltransferase involved in cell wall biosynthesis
MRQVANKGEDSMGKGRPVIFVCLVFHPDTSASSILFTDLFVRMAVQGQSITVLSGFPSKDGQEQVASLPREEVYGGVRIVRCGLRMEGKRSLWTRALAYSSFLLHAGWHLLRAPRAARIVGGTDPPFTPWLMRAVSTLARRPYELILLDIYPDGFVALGRLAASSPVTRVWRAMNRLSYRGARRIIVIGRDMITRLENIYGIDPAGVAYIPHWATTEVEQVSPNGRGPLLAQFGLEEKFVVQYAGNMGLWHDMPALVEAAALLQDDPRIHFLFIGKGRQRAPAERRARALGLTNITWADFVPREALRDSLASCDAALISLRAGMEGVAVPSKLYGILASGRAVVAQVPRDSEVAYVVEEEACGCVVEPGDITGLADAVRHLAANPTQVRDMGGRAHAAYRARYTIEHAVDTYLRIWED